MVETPPLMVSYSRVQSVPCFCDTNANDKYIRRDTVGVDNKHKTNERIVMSAIVSDVRVCPRLAAYRDDGGAQRWIH